MLQLAVVDQAAGRYVHWGVLQISVTNLAIIGIMLLLFVLALVLPFPGASDGVEQEPRP
jgi:hypothetical protein